MTIYIIRTGIPHLPLHSGPAPRWLFTLMVRLAREVLGHVVSEYGAEEVLRRLSDPFWCQAFGCLLGFDCHSSGVTATTGGAVKEAVKGLEHDFGFAVATAGWTPVEITAACERLAYPPIHWSLQAAWWAKFDSAAVQDGYQRYHQCFSLP
jgi:hypothetical protein